MAALSKAEPTPVLITQGPEYTPEFVLQSDAHLLHAGEGDFTCCARNHEVYVLRKHTHEQKTG